MEGTSDMSHHGYLAGVGRLCTAADGTVLAGAAHGVAVVVLQVGHLLLQVRNGVVVVAPAVVGGSSRHRGAVVVGRGVVAGGGRVVAGGGRTVPCSRRAIPCRRGTIATRHGVFEDVEDWYTKEGQRKDGSKDEDNQGGDQVDSEVARVRGVEEEGQVIQVREVIEAPLNTLVLEQLVNGPETPEGTGKETEVHHLEPLISD